MRNTKSKKTKNPQKKVRPTAPGISRKPDCDHPKENAPQLKKNIKNGDINQGKNG